MAAGRQSEGLHLVDVEKIFQRLLGAKYGLPGDEAFQEHVHLNFARNYAVASALENRITHLLPRSIQQSRSPDTELPSPERCAELMSWTPWDRIRVLNHLKKFISKPPFTHQLGSEAGRNRRAPGTSETAGHTHHAGVDRRSLSSGGRAIS